MIQIFEKDLEDFLKAWGLLELVIHRTKNANNHFNQIPYRSLDLWRAFSWDDTDEGFEFWECIVDMYEDSIVSQCMESL